MGHTAGMARHMHHRHHRSLIFSAIVLSIFLLLMLSLNQLMGARQHRVQAAAAPGDWTTYMANIARNGYNAAETSITRATAHNLKVQWTMQAAGEIVTQPVVAEGVVYWGDWSGLEHATSVSTHTNLWSIDLGKAHECGVYPHGISSTATITSVLINGTATTVDIVGGDSNLYALDASSGAILWKTSLGTAPSNFIYSSPTFYNGSIYIGVSSYNDCPEIQGHLVKLNASTGKIQQVFYVVPDGCLGGGIWGSPAIDATTGIVYVATGDVGTCSTTETLVSAVLALNARDLTLISSWQVPNQVSTSDYEFGSTPTLFKATIGGTLIHMLGMINKNGDYYAFDRSDLSAGPKWKRPLADAGGSPDRGQGSISSSAWDGTSLYVGGSATTINGTACGGSVSALSPTDGALLWRVCLRTSVVGAVTVVPGVVVIGTGPNVLLVGTSDGQKLFTYTDSTIGSRFFGAPTIAHGQLFVGNNDGNFAALGLS